MAAEASASQTAYRTHLFCDLRGYTSFLEQAGNAAGAEMLDRYRRLVRAAVGRHGGTEVSTEGDAFYVVFPSASAAVMCGLAIVDGAAAENREHPDRPIHIGVGIHSGEVVETAETFVGTAVNVAARVCAVARPGEVLVSATVRGITHGSVPAGFVSRGKKRLKGLAEPVEVFTVVAGGQPAAARRAVPKRGVVGLGLVGLVSLALVGVVALLPRAGPTATPAASQVRTAGIGALAIGEYQSAQFSPRLHFVVSDLGWTLNRESIDTLSLLYEYEPTGGLEIGLIGRINTDPCGGGSSVPAGRTPAAILSATEQAPFLHVTESHPVNIGGHPGISADLQVDAAAQAACGGLAGSGASGVDVLSLSGEVWRAATSETIRLIALENGGETISILISVADPSATSIDATERFFSLADRIVQSIRM